MNCLRQPKSLDVKQVVACLEGTRRHSFSIVGATSDQDGLVLVRFVAKGRSRTFQVSLDIANPQCPTWMEGIYSRHNALSAADAILDFLREEIDTGATLWGLQYPLPNGDWELVTAEYGIRIADPKEHREMAERYARNPW